MRARTGYNPKRKIAAAELLVQRVVLTERYRLERSPRVKDNLPLPQ